MIVKDLLVLTQAVNEGVVNLLGTCRSIIYLWARRKKKKKSLQETCHADLPLSLRA